MSLNTYPNNPFPPSTEQMHGGDNEELQAQIDAIKDSATIDSFGDVETALATKTDNDVIAPEFDAEAGVYSVGDLVMHEGKLYEFTTAHETAGVWNPEEVTEKTVADEVDTLKSGLTSLNNKVTGLYNAVVFDPALTSIDVDISENNLIWLVGFECAISANAPCGGLYVLVKQGTYISLTALKEAGTPGLSVTIKSSNVLTFSWTAVNDFGGNITMMPMIFWHD